MSPIRRLANRFSTSRWFGVPLLAAVVLAMALPALDVRAAPPAKIPPQSPSPDGVWNLVNTDEFDSWQGNNFHGLDSEYTPFYDYSSFGATYTQYNMVLNPDFPRTIASKLTGTCAWNWSDGNIPQKIEPGKKYPYTLSVDAQVSGNGFLGGTVNGYTLDSQKQGSIAYSQVYLDINGEVLSGHNETGAFLAMESGMDEGEQRKITLQCDVDIVTVKAVYTYEWSKTGCNATLSLPNNMKPGEKFSPQATVVDANGKAATPKNEAWFFNGSPSGKTMTWDGKAGVLEYRYTCPGETQPKSAKIDIPAAGACIASITLPGNMEPGKSFTPYAAVTNQEGSVVMPKEGKWFYNGAASSGEMNWDGSAAEVSYQFICPTDNKASTVKASIPAAEGGTNLVLVGGLAAVVAAGLAAAAAGAALLKSSSNKPADPPPPRYALSVNRRLIEVKPRETQSITVQVWRIDANGSVSPATNASISIHIPSSPGGLAASPTSGFGSLVCAFSVPRPTVCETVTVVVSASAGNTNVSTQVQVKIVPLYKLELEWQDPQKTSLPADGREIYACSRLTATPPPDADSTPDNLARLINISLTGSNSANVEMRSAPPESATPTVNDGALWIPLRLASAPDTPGEPVLHARYTAGSLILEKDLIVGLSKNLVLGAWVQGKKQMDVKFHKNLPTPAWDFSEIIAYFHEPEKDGVPLEPSFEYEFNADSIEFDPPVLQVREIYQHASHQYTLQVGLKDEIDLDQFFGPHLQELNGVIHVTITVKDRSQKTYQARLEYHLRPQLELFAAYPAAVRSVRGLELEKNQLIADSDDQLEVFIGCCRSDRPEPRGLDYTQQVDSAWWALQGILQGDAAGDYKSIPSEESDAGEKSVLIQSIKPILFKPERAGEKLVLHAEGVLNSDLPPVYLRTPLALDVEVKALLPNLRLWVVPGKQRGVSEAWAFTFLGDDTHKPLADTALKITTESVTGGAPALLTNSGAKEISLITGEDGSGQADLFYSGMDWSNYQEALFIVRCCITNRSGDVSGEAVKAAVNVKENVQKCLADLFENASVLKLNNPCFEGQPMLGLSSLVPLTVYRPFVRGLVWNTLELFSGNESAHKAGDKKAKFAHDYVCSEFRDRICEWLIRRRHYAPGRPDSVEQIACMNGIEFDHFIIANGLHNYEALFLSGMEPTADPRGLDPWWKQHWKNPEVLEPDGLVNNTWERYYCLESASWLSVHLVPVAMLGMMTGGGALSALIPIIGPIIAGYAAATTGELAPATAYSMDSYNWFRKERLYKGRQPFLKDWAAANPKG